MKKIIILLVATFFMTGCSLNTKTPINIQDNTPNANLGSINKNVSEQLSFFETYIDDTLIPAGNDCIILANYNNLSKTLPQKELREALPETKQFYYDSCQKSFAKLATSVEIAAEPELVDLRKIITNYTKAIKELAVFALEGKYDAAEIDSFSSQRKELLIRTREEILRINKIYNVK